ncbi:MAG: type II secretion system F family protein [Verrucomicrobiota bacterium]
MSLPHRKLAACYLQLNRQLGAGLTFHQALSAPSAIPVGERRRLAGLIEEGRTLPEVLDAAGDWLPDNDRLFLIAASQTGRLPVVLHALSGRHEQLAKLRSRVLLACLYPVGVLHFGALVFAFFRLIDWERGIEWDPVRFGLGVAMVLGPVWAGGLLLGWLIRLRFPPALWLLNLLPAIGGYRRNQALADFAFALGNLLEAGAPIGAAWEGAGHIAGSPRIARAAADIVNRIEARELPGAHLERHRVFPHDFVALYQTGEATGSLDRTLLQLAEVHRERADNRLKVAAFLYPSLLFFAVALMIAGIVVSFYAGYIGGMLKLIDGG